MEVHVGITGVFTVKCYRLIIINSIGSAGIPCSLESVFTSGSVFPWVLVFGWDQVTSWSVLLEDRDCLFYLYLFPLSALDGVHSEYTCGWDFKGLATPGTERPLTLSGLVNVTQGTLAAVYNSSQCLLSIYCMPHALHTEEGWR